MKKLLCMAALATSIMAISATDVNALGCGLFGSRGEKQFTPVRNIVQRARTITSNVADRILPRRAARVTFVEVDTTETRVQISGIRPRATNCSPGF